LAIALLPPAAADAQKPAMEKPGKGPAYTQPPAKDPNYQLMGEFAGRIRVPGEKDKQKRRQTVALQIRPIAGNQFHARAYYGGLPGQPKHVSDDMFLIGLRSGDHKLVLSGGPWAIFVDPDGCNLVDSEGVLLGRLDRVQRVSPTLGAQPPEGAIVIFDGSGTEQFSEGEMTDHGLLKEGAVIKPMFQDFNLHVEFRLPYMPQADGQARGNSGLYLQSRYECQVLDSFGTEPLYNGLGALYRMKTPDVNMAFPPLVWQTYDVHFTAPRWAADGTKLRDAHITSWVNGVKVQDNVALPSKTGAGQTEAPSLLPIKIQDHGDPVRFRNIWVIDRGLTRAKFPVRATKEQREQAAKLEWNEPPKPEPSEDKEQAKDKPAEAEAKQEAAEKPADKPAETDKQTSRLGSA
jgi:hypothetical protein